MIIKAIWGGVEIVEVNIDNPTITEYNVAQETFDTIFNGILEGKTYLIKVYLGDYLMMANYAFIMPDTNSPNYEATKIGIVGSDGSYNLRLKQLVVS